MNEYGGLVVANGPGAGVNAVGVAFGQVTGFNAPSEAYSQQAGRQGVVPDAANNRVLAQKGKYKVEVALSFLEVAANNKIFTLAVAKNGVAQLDLSTSFSGINAANTVLDPGLTGVLVVNDADCSELPYVGPAVPANVPSAPQPTQQPPVAAITLQIKASAAESLTLQYGQFTLYRLPD